MERISGADKKSARSLLRKACGAPPQCVLHGPYLNLKEQTMAAKTLNDLFIHALSDVYSAEKQLTKALPRLARACTNPLLKEAFDTHLEETQGQIVRIDQVVELSEIKLKRVKCVAMEGLVEEGQEQIDEIEKGPILDAALIAAGQKVEHYEIATYGTLATLAKKLGYGDAVKLLLETLEEEKATDKKLTLLAEQELSEQQVGK
jgi:ferritin-like metal-binding protein YciE